MLSSVMATIEITCEGCEFDYCEIIAKLHFKNDLCYEFLREHGVLPAAIQCPYCVAPWRNSRGVEDDPQPGTSCSR